MSDLFVGVSYNLNSNQFEIETNAKDPRKIITEFLRTQIGAGKDESPVNEIDDYKIRIDLDLSCDAFRCTHDCGNLGLRDGILLTYLREENHEHTRQEKHCTP